MAVARSIMSALVRPTKKKHWYSYLDLIITGVIVLSTFIVMMVMPQAAPSAHTSAQHTSTQSSTAYAGKQGVRYSHMIPVAGNPGGGAPTADTPQYCTDHPADCQDSNKCILSPNLCADFGGPTSYSETISGTNPLEYVGEFMFFTEPSLTYNSDRIQQMWLVMLGVVDIFMILMVLLNGIRIMFSGMVFRFADAAETLPNILLALIAAHLSIIFARATIQLDNTATVGFYNWTHSGKIQITQAHIEDNSECVGFGFLGMCPFGRHDYNADTNPPGQVTNINLDSFTSPADAFQSMSDLVNFAIQVLVLMVFVQLLVRLFFIDLFIILAPIGIAAWGLPGKSGQALTSLWLKSFLTTVLVQFVQAIAMEICEIMIGEYMRYTQTNLPGLMDNLTVMRLAMLTTVWFVFRIPSLFNTAPMRTMIEGGQAIGQVANTAKQMSVSQTQSLISMGASIGGMAALAFI